MQLGNLNSVLVKAGVSVFFVWVSFDKHVKRIPQGSFWPVWEGKKQGWSSIDSQLEVTGKKPEKETSNYYFCEVPWRDYFSRYCYLDLACNILI